MMATGLGSFVSGAFEGYQNVKEIQRKEAMAQRDEERFAMEKQRYANEQERAARESKREADIEAARQEAMQAEKDADSGAGDFTNLADPAALQARQQTTQSVEEKGTRSYEQKEMLKLGVRPPADAPSNSVTQAETDILKKGGVGLYKNQKAADDLLVDKQLGAYRKILIARGEVDKAMSLNELAQEMKDKGIARMQKNAAAFVMADADPAQVANAVSKVYGFVKDGKEVDPTKTTFDAKTGTYNFAVVDQATGAIEQRPMNKQQLLTALGQFTPAKMFELKLGQEIRAEDKAEAKAREEREFGIKERQLGVSQSVANAQIKRYNALSAAEDKAAKGSEQKAKVETIQKLFPIPDLSFEKMAVLTEAQKKSKMDEAVRNTDLFEKTSQLSGLNPKVDVQTLANAARLISNGTLQARKDKDGTTFTNIGSTRVVLP
jgi:hypothetical protein